MSLLLLKVTGKKATGTLILGSKADTSSWQGPGAEEQLASEPRSHMFSEGLSMTCVKVGAIEGTGGGTYVKGEFNGN